VAEQRNGELQQYVKTTLKQTETELSQMREILHDKLGEDQLTHIKNKEKNVALFNEVVRLGQEFEKQGAQLQQLSLATETKIQSIEALAVRTEQEAANAENLGNSVSGLLAGVSEKSEKRLNQLENAFQLLLVAVAADR
jgi:hypothetical protein